MPVVFSARSVPQPQSVNPPTVPTGVVANALSTSMIEVDWNPSTDPGGPGVKDYGVYRFGVLIQRVIAPTTTFTDTGLSQGTSYTYTVTARDLNNLESAQSAPATAQTQGGIVDGSQLSINGSGFGTKSRALAPIVWDNQKDTAPSTHAVSPQYAPTQTSPLNATGGVFYDMQNRPPGWAPSGYQAGLPHPFLGGTITGCHLRQVNGPNVNEYNDVMVGVAGTVPTTTFCFRHEYYGRYDANWIPNPRSDQNLKEFSYNEGLVIQPPANFVYFTGPANASSVESNIRSITNANPCVISYVWPFATAPVSVGDTVIPFGVPGMTQINGIQCVVTNVAGANPNYQATIAALNSTSFGTHPGLLTVTAITKGNQSTTPARVTFTAPGANPCVGGENVGFTGVGGMTQINIQNLLQQITVLDAGGSGASCFVDIDLDTTGFTTYTSGGSICFGMAPTTWGPWTTTRQLTTDGTAQGSPTGMWQNPDNNGRSGSSLSFWNQFFWRTNSANGWMKWLIEGCYDTTTGGAGYVNIWDTSLGNNQRNKVVFFAGKDANNFLGQFCLGVGYYSRDRSANNWRNFGGVFTDWSAGGVTGQCACVYVGDNPTYANCVVLEPQITSSWTDTSITVPHFNQGALKNGSTGYIFVATEAGASGTAVAAGSISIGTANVPTITTTTLPAASVGVAYSTALSATGGVSPYTWYLPTVIPNTGTWLGINASTGVLSGTPGTIETESVYVGLSDANGNSAYATLTLNVQSSITFDFFISPTGSDTNTGTSVSSPWSPLSIINRAINANNKVNFGKLSGKKVGFMPGTYDYSGQMQNSSGVGACHIPGGISALQPTTYASCDANGNYSPRTATFNAKTAGGLFGGGLNYPNNGPILSHIASSISNPVGFIVIDGLRFTGYNYKGIRIGGLSSGDSPAIGGSVIIQNCEFFGQGQNAGAAQDNENSVWIDGCRTTGSDGNGPFIVQNNYFHDNFPNNTAGQSSIAAVQVWKCHGAQILNNTCVTSGGFWGKDDDNEGTLIAYNYIDDSLFTSSPDLVQSIQDFTGATTAGLNQTTSIHHNIIIGNCAMWLMGLSNESFTTPLNVYNNTISMTNHGTYMRFYGVGTASKGKIQFYNNITTGTTGGGGYGDLHTSGAALQIWDYNGYTPGNNWQLVADGGTGFGTNFTTAAAFASAVSSAGGVANAESHSVANATPQFTATGTFAAQYKLAATSPFFGKGSTDGTTSGAPTDMGAWGNGATQIGANWVS